MEPVNEHTEYRLRVPRLDDERLGQVRSSLADLPGVADVRFPSADEVVVVADPDVVSEDELLAAIGATGIEARPA